MKKYVSGLVAALAVGFMLVGFASDADAAYRRRCGGCGPIAPSYSYSTTNKVVHRTRYRDVNRTRYVQRTKRYVHVTRVRPIVRIHEVTRVHHRTVAVVRPVHQRYTQYLPARTVVTRSVRNYYDCGCGSRY